MGDQPRIPQRCLTDGDRAAQAAGQGADFVSIGKSALANPGWPLRVRDSLPLREFDKRLLAPAADVKESELDLLLNV